MEILIFLGIIFILMIPGIIDGRKQRLKNKAAQDVLMEFDIQKEEAAIKDIKKKYAVGLLQSCPKCNKELILLKDAYGEYLSHHSNFYKQIVKSVPCDFKIRF